MITKLSIIAAVIVFSFGVLFPTDNPHVEFWIGLLLGFAIATAAYSWGRENAIRIQ